MVWSTWAVREPEHRRRDPRSQILVALGAGDRVPPPCRHRGEELGITDRGAAAELALAPVAEQHLLEVLDDVDRQAPRVGEWLRGLDRAREVRGVDRVDLLVREPLRERVRLRPSDLVETGIVDSGVPGTTSAERPCRINSTSVVPGDRTLVRQLRLRHGSLLLAHRANGTVRA